jgi:hypothetical protein
MDDGAGRVIGRLVTGCDVARRRDLVSEEKACGTPEMVGDEDVADASEDHADDESGRGGVECERDVEAAPAEIGETENEAADESAEHREAALPDREHVAPGLEALHVTEDVEAARADDGTQRAPGDGVVHLVARDAPRLGTAGHQVGAGEESERGAEAVWGDGAPALDGFVGKGGEEDAHLLARETTG